MGRPDRRRRGPPRPWARHGVSAGRRGGAETGASPRVIARRPGGRARSDVRSGGSPAIGPRGPRATEASVARRGPRRRPGRRARPGRGSARGTEGHSDESTTSRSTTSVSSTSASPSHSRLTAPATERGQVGDQQREHDRRRVARSLAAQAQLDDLGENLAAADGEVADECVGFDAARPARHGHEEDRPRGMPLGEPGQDLPRLVEPHRRRPDDMGHRARPELRRGIGLLPEPLLRELPLDLGDDAHATVSGYARSGRRAAPTRPHEPGPTSRPRSRGSSAGLGPRPRRSRRRASTAPRPRPRA